MTVNKKKKVYLTTSLCILTIGMLLNTFYRPYIYKYSINDFGFADTIGSLASVICFCFFVWGIRKGISNKEKNKQIVLAVIV